MSHNYSGRVTVILGVLGLALLAVLWPSVANPMGVGFNSNVPLSQKLNLKPGIDIVGGTSLQYQIKPAPGTVAAPDLAEQVTKALKQRIDKDGTRNLIWRPQNPDKIEIQMPLSGSGGKGAQAQKQMEEARAKLEATNVRVADAMAWVEQGANRDAGSLDRLAAGSAERKKILQDLTSTFDLRQKLEAEKDPAKEEEHNLADAKYEKLPGDLARTNLSAADLERALSARDAGTRDKKIAALKQASAAFPSRLAAIDQYATARKDLNDSGGGLESAADLKRLLRGSGVLEFHILPKQSDASLTDASHPGGYADWQKQLQENGPRGNPGDTYRWFVVDNPDEFKGSNSVDYQDQKWVLASVKPNDSLDPNSGNWKLADAREGGNQMGQRVVSFEFDTLGGKLFGDLTKAHTNEPMAIMLDGRIISAPNINEPITNGGGQISGGQNGFSGKELGYLITMLKSGALPAQLSDEPIAERTVGPQLGEDNLFRGLGACGVALVIVAVFLIGYYHLSGLVAFIGVMMNLVIILGAMAALNATFTLPGIAAVVLTVGSAVDANVLIFERLREEQHRGLAIRMAIRNAYDRAFSAILDSNMTTLITSAFLIAFGTEEVKGFGIALIIGILASLFTSLFVTKTLFGILIDKFGVTKLGSLPLSFPRWDAALKPNVRWTKLIVPFAAFSGIFILLGCILFFKYSAAGQMLDIDFASGTAVTFELKDPTNQETVRKWIDAEALKHPEVLPAANTGSIGTDGRTWEVTTPNEKAVEVRDAIVSAVGEHLAAERPSSFVGVGQKLDQAIASAAGPATGPSTSPASNPALAHASGGGIASAGSLVLPLTPENLADKSKWPDGVVPEDAKRYTGGAAIFLRQLNPPLSPKQVTDRINHQRLQPQTGAASLGAAADFSVVSPTGADAPSSLAILLTADPARDYRKGEEAWKRDVAEPLWELSQQAIASPPKLQQVKNFNASVAGETQKDAIVALVLSLIAIMAYIWVRFGNLKYGTATVVALVHDVLFVIAAIGFAHLLYQTILGNVLQLAPFRIGLTTVAGILTIMGYSMLDTIVVFDRIREIRGKYGHVSTTVINDAVNQTLSRTLLTAGTTVISVGIMYFLGGEGIHGFTFVLFVGILAGTYSSVAIASPVLLIGGEKTEENPVHPPRTAATT